MLPAYFAEELQTGAGAFPLTARAVEIVRAIGSQRVEAFAPGLLVHEFTKRSLHKAQARRGGPSIEEVCRQAHSFFKLPVAYVHMIDLAEQALDLTTNYRISPPDSWFVACAIYCDAELWISHEHEDGLVRAARSVHDKVFLLTERRFG